MVKIIVSGQEFIIDSSKITSSDNLLKDLLKHTTFSKNDSDSDCILTFERDPELFEYLSVYLSKGYIPFTNNPDTLLALQCEADFFGLDSFLEKLQCFFPENGMYNGKGQSLGWLGWRNWLWKKCVTKQDHLVCNILRIEEGMRGLEYSL